MKLLQHRQYRARRMQALNDIKLARGCVDCGYAEHPAALDFDHRDREAKGAQWARRSFAANIERNWADLLTEIAKCDVRCANCHRIKSFEQGHHRPLRSQPDPELPPSLFD